MITAVPPPVPVTIPHDDPTVATDGEPDIHVPLGVGHARGVVCPTQTTGVPVIGKGRGLTTIVVVEKHPVLNL